MNKKSLLPISPSVFGFKFFLAGREVFPPNQSSLEIAGTLVIQSG